jgi:predicted short-subunit dehydrogenase-like oxidoreductase (DUF2520 family)
MSKRKPTVTVIGAGRLGTALAIALSRNGYAIQALVGRRKSKLKKAASLLHDPVDLLALEEIKKPGDIALITTPDDQLPAVASSLGRLQIDSRHPPTALHTSGAISSEILLPLAKLGWRIGSIHPLVSISEPLAGAQLFKGAFWCVEGDRRAIQQGRRLIRNLAGRSFSIKSNAKPLYHAAAVMTSGNVVALFDIAIDMLSHCGLKRDEAQRILVPLLQSTFTNLESSNPAKALTGTFSRGDLETVKRHLAALSGKELESARALYRLLGRKALQLSESNGLDRTISRRIATLLK